MSILFMDSSALAKRYMPETGTRWVRTQSASSSGNIIVIAQITAVEVYSAMSRQYHDGIIPLVRLQAFKKLFTRHMRTQYRVLSLSDSIIQNALSLQESYRLRAYDAIQLASAHKLNKRLSTVGHTFMFVSADKRLLQSASTSGLTTDNPNNYA